MPLLVSALIVAAAALAGAWLVARALEASREPADRLLPLLQTFAPAAGAIDRDPRALLAWAPLARTARRLFAGEFAALDRAAGAPFPFGPDEIQNAHARWTADWLAWEVAHDIEYKLKAAVLESELASSIGTPIARARLDAVEREKLDRYQRRYEEYVLVAKAIQALAG